MGLRPAVSVPAISPAEMELMISRAGLVLNPGQMADLVLAWRQIVQLSALIPRDRPLADDQAFAFRLAPPQSKRRPGVKRSVARPPGGQPASPQRAAGRKTAPKRR